MNVLAARSAIKYSRKEREENAKGAMLFLMLKNLCVLCDSVAILA